MEKRIEQLIAMQAEWTDKTFGENRKPQQALHHMKEEVLETIEALDEYELLEEGEDRGEAALEVMFEFADLFLLLLDSSRNFGLKFSEIISLAEVKTRINKSHRTWGDADENGVVKHVKLPPKATLSGYTNEQTSIVEEEADRSPKVRSKLEIVEEDLSSNYNPNLEPEQTSIVEEEADLPPKVRSSVEAAEEIIGMAKDIGKTLVQSAVLSSILEPEEERSLSENSFEDTLRQGIKAKVVEDMNAMLNISEDILRKNPKLSDTGLKAHTLESLASRLSRTFRTEVNPCDIDTLLESDLRVDDLVTLITKILN